MSKYIDLAEQIHAETRDGVYLDEVGEVLSWLDRNPDQAPGRTITQSEFRDAYSAFGDMDGPDCYWLLLDLLGIAVTPDPDPTNFESSKPCSKAATSTHSGVCAAAE